MKLTLFRGAAVVLLLTGLLWQIELWQREVWGAAVFSDASRLHSIVLQPAESVSFSFLPQTEELKGLLLKANTSDEQRLRVQVVQAEKSLIVSREATLVSPGYGFDVQMLPSHSKVSPGVWLWIADLNMQVVPDVPLRVTITNEGDNPLSLWKETDETTFEATQLIHRGHRVQGHLGFMALNSLSWGQTWKYVLIQENSLIYVLGSAVLALLGLILVWFLRSRRLPHLMLVGVVGLIYSLPLYADMTHWGAWDWPEAASFYLAARNNLLAGDFPWWNPYMCGGTSLWHDPQVFWPSLDFLLAMVFGFVIGSKVAITFYVLVAMIGMYRLARYFSRSQTAAALAAVVFGGSGFFAARIAAGHTGLLTAAAIPWVLLFFLRSFKRRGYIVLAALLWLLVFMAGQMYIATYLAIGVLLLALSLGFWKVVPWRRIVTQVLVFGLLTMTLGAVKVLPTLFYLQDTTDRLEESPVLEIWQVPQVLLARHAGLKYDTPNIGGLWHEYAAYIGPLAVGLAMVGILRVITHKERSGYHWLLVLLFFLVAALIPPSFTVLEFIPILRELHNPGRYLVMVIFSLALLTAWGWDALRSYFSPSAHLVVGWLLVVVIASDLINVARPGLSELFTRPLKTQAKQEQFVQLGGHTDNALHVVEAGLGAPAYCSPHARLWHAGAEVSSNDAEEYRGEVYSLKGAAEVRDYEIAGSHIDVQLGTVKNSDYLVVNQKYDRGWQAGDREVVDTKGLIALKLSLEDSGKSLRFWYRPPYWRVGLIISGLSVLILLGWFFKIKEVSVIDKQEKSDAKSD